MFFGDSYGQNEINSFLKEEKPKNKPLDSHYSNYYNYSNSEKKYKKMSYTPINSNNNNLIRKKRSNKRVKFNSKIDIVYVESYKKYNKIDDGDENNYLNYYLNNYARAQQMNNINKKKNDGCTCNIS